jgi:transposase-like protein
VRAERCEIPREYRRRFADAGRRGKHYPPEEKAGILRLLLEKEPISKLCDELGLV